MTLKRIRTFTNISIICAITLITFVLSACGPGFEPYSNILVENQSDQSLTVFFQDRGTNLSGKLRKIGVLGQNEQLNFSASGITGIISAKNTAGELVFWKYFDYDNLEKVKKSTYKAVIPSDTPHVSLKTIDLAIRNMNGDKLYVYVDAFPLGYIFGGENVTSTVPVKWVKYGVSAKDSSGNTAYNREFNPDYLDVLNGPVLQVNIFIHYRNINFQNDTDTVLEIFVNYNYVGAVKPGGSDFKTCPWYDNKDNRVSVKAVSPNHKVYYYKSFTHEMSEELSEAGDIIVIKPPVKK
jgi:hypothetical protein